MILKTERLTLRPLLPEDLQAFARLNADPRVMEFFPGTKSFAETEEEYNRIVKHFKTHGWGFWVASHDNAFIGFIGMQNVRFEASFTPAVEIGWRLAQEYWGKGFATEGASACLQFGFEELKLPQIVALTTPQNVRSRNVMEKIGMKRDPEDDFDHPLLPEGHPLRRHVLYRIAKP